MDYDRLPGPDGLEIRVARDDAHRTCAVCGGDCPPEPIVDPSAGARVAFVCREHGVQAIVDPFHDLRD